MLKDEIKLGGWSEDVVRQVQECIINLYNEKIINNRHIDLINKNYLYRLAILLHIADVGPKNDLDFENFLKEAMEAVNNG